MKRIGLIILAPAVLFSGCVEHTTINARVVTVTRPTSIEFRTDVKAQGVPLP